MTISQTVSPLRSTKLQGPGAHKHTVGGVLTLFVTELGPFRGPKSNLSPSTETMHSESAAATWSGGTSSARRASNDVAVVVGNIDATAISVKLRKRSDRELLGVRASYIRWLVCS